MIVIVLLPLTLPLLQQQTEVCSSKWQVRRRHHFCAICRYVRLGYQRLANVTDGFLYKEKAPFPYPLP